MRQYLLVSLARIEPMILAHEATIPAGTAAARRRERAATLQLALAMPATVDPSAFDCAVNRVLSVHVAHSGIDIDGRLALQ